MALSFTNLTEGGTTTDATSFTTASIAPTGDRLVLLSVFTGNNPTPVAPTVTGGGMTTWTIVNSTTRSNASGLFVFRALEASPTSGTVLIDFGAESMNSAVWCIDQSSADVVTTGTNGADAIVQTSAANAAGGLSYAVTMAALASGNNVGWGAICHTANELATASGSYTELGSTSTGSSDNLSIITIWQQNDNSPGASWATSQTRLAVVAEIAYAAAGGAAAKPKLLGMMGCG
jgi:hypothetical protein